MSYGGRRRSSYTKNISRRSQAKPIRLLSNVPRLSLSVSVYHTRKREEPPWPETKQIPGYGEFCIPLSSMIRPSTK